MTHDDVQNWLEGYIAAWRSNDPEDIADLFTEDAVYGYRPWDNDQVTVRGRESIVASWLDSPDDPSMWEAHYEPFVVEANKAVALGWSKYRPSETHPERTYHNAYILEFGDDGRCSSFHEFYILHKE